MKTTHLVALLVAACAGLLLAAAAACESEAELPLGVYLRRVQALDDQADTRQLELSSKAAQASGLSEEEQLQSAREAFQESANIYRDLRDGLAKLDPPPAAEAEHRALVEALTDFVQMSQEIADRARDAPTGDALSALTSELLNSDRAKQVGRQVEKACEDLQVLALENSLDAGLECNKTG